jgi:hypothetical protein
VFSMLEKKHRKALRIGVKARSNLGIGYSNELCRTAPFDSESSVIFSKW